jgi:chromosome segregation ATPase
MIRAFAPGMMMQDPLPQAATPFDVRNEPTAPESEPPLAEQNDASGELARLEELLVERTRERRELAQELDRRSALLRDACARLTELGPRVAEAATEHAVRSLREERDAAVARAVEAEVARAEATFRVDELMGQLLGTGRSLADLTFSPSPSERTLNARLAELDEQKQMAEARLVLLEDELAQERSHVATAARDRVETAERLEFEIGQARVWADTAQQKLAELADARGALLGERDGVRSRLGEAERALRSSQERLARALHHNGELKDKLEVERAERATTRALANAQALQIDELTRTRAQEQDQLRELREAHERERSRVADGVNASPIVVELQAELERERAQRAETTTAFAAREGMLAELMTELERERAQRGDTASVRAAHEATITALRAQLDQERSHSADSANALAARDSMLNQLEVELEHERLQSAESANLVAEREAMLSDLQAELERLHGSQGLAGIEATLAEVQAEVERKQLQISASTKALTAREAALTELQGELERERSARSWLAAQLAAAEAGRGPATEPESSHRRIEASQQEQLETLRACLLELRLPLVEFETELSRIARGKGRAPHDSAAAPGIDIDPDTLSALDEQLRQKDAKLEELEAALAAERQARAASPAAEREARAAARDTSVATLKGELIDVRANATRLSDDLTKERTRRRKMAVTVRALQAASESGEAPGPWIEELIALITEGTSMPPKT